MKRPVFIILAVLSLVMGAATCALWLRSNWVVEQWQIFRISGNENEPTTFASTTLFAGLAGGIGFNRQWERLDPILHHPPTAEEKARMGYPVHTVLDGSNFHRKGHVWTQPRFFLGFAFESDHSHFLDGQIEDSNVLVGVPYWFLVTVLIFPPVIWWRRRKRGSQTGNAATAAKT